MPRAAWSAIAARFDMIPFVPAIRAFVKRPQTARPPRLLSCLLKIRNDMNQTNDSQFEGAPAPQFDDLRLENELLKLKMRAELGAQFGTFTNGPQLDPVLERQFLERVIEFERLHDELQPVPIREYLGNPEFRPAAALDVDELNSEWKRLTDLYRDKEFGVDFLADYPLSVMYDFMAGELLDQEVEPMPGWCFIYEEFHPNHDYDIRERAADFMDELFKGTFCQDTLCDGLAAPDGSPCDLPEAQRLLDRFHDTLGPIEAPEFEILGLRYDAETLPGGNSPAVPGTGLAEGVVRYSIRTQQGMGDRLSGPYSLQLECRFGWWSVRAFEVHGFSWVTDAL